MRAYRLQFTWRYSNDVSEKWHALRQTSRKIRYYVIRWLLPPQSTAKNPYINASHCVRCATQISIPVCRRPKHASFLWINRPLRTRFLASTKHSANPRQARVGFYGNWLVRRTFGRSSRRYCETGRQYGIGWGFYVCGHSRRIMLRISCNLFIASP